MNTQQFFNFDLGINENIDLSNYYVNKTNFDAYSIINNKLFNENIFLKGPNKSGKTHLGKIWLKLNDAILFKDNLNEIISSNRNVLIDEKFININEENLLHIINHCKNEKLKILLTSNIDLFEFNFKILDLLSRLKTFHYININNPDDEMSVLLLTKFLTEKQFIIKNKEIFDFLIRRVNRSYESLYNLVNKIDKLSLEKNRQLTVPLIKEIL